MTCSRLEGVYVIYLRSYPTAVNNQQTLTGPDESLWHRIRPWSMIIHDLDTVLIFSIRLSMDT